MNLAITTNDIVRGAVNIANYVVTGTKALLIVLGAIGMSFADVTFGAITLNLLFGNMLDVEGIRLIKALPIVFSIAATGMQLILWQMIEDKRGITSIFRGADLSVWLALASAIVLFVGDTYMDISSVKYLMSNSQIAAFLTPKEFNMLRIAVQGIAVVMASFSELFLVLAFSFLMKSDTSNGHSQRPQQHLYNRPHERPREERPDVRRMPETKYRTPKEYMDAYRDVKKEMGDEEE